MAFFVENENLRKALALRQEGNPEALVWLEKACASGDGKALFWKYCSLRHGGFFLEHNFALASLCLQESAKAGCPWGMLELGSSRYALSGLKEKDRHVWLSKALASNDDYTLGKSFLEGVGVGKNIEKARKYLLHAAQLGNPFAQMDLAQFANGLCGSKKEATVWSEKAAKFGEASALHVMGVYDREGDGVDKGKSLYMSYFLQGAKQKHALCCMEVGHYYLAGIGCQKSAPLSAMFYLDSCNRFTISDRLIADFDDPRIRLQELFVYGRRLSMVLRLRSSVGEQKCANAIRIYEESTTAARKASLFFVWICKQTKQLSRDIQRLTGKIIFVSREDPSIWNVVLQK